RYVEPLSVAYHAVSGAMLEHGESLGPTAAGDAFQVMERLRARGLLETMLTEHARIPPVPTVAQIQAALVPREAMISFQTCRAEPTTEAPYRQGSSWATVITSGGVQAVRRPGDGAVGAAGRRLLRLRAARR